MQFDPEYNHSFVIIIPTECCCRDPLPAELVEKNKKAVFDQMTRWFGGSTSYVDSAGQYTMDDGEIAAEKNRSIISGADNDHYLAHRNDFLLYVHELANTLSQEAIYYSIDQQSDRAFMTARTCVHGKKIEPTSGSVARFTESTRQRLAQRNYLIDLADEVSARKLVTEFWGYAAADQSLELGDRSGELTAEPPKVISDQHGFQILYVRLQSLELGRADERRVIDLLHRRQQAIHGLYLIANRDGSIWHLVNARHKEARAADSELLLRRFSITAHRPSNSVVRALSRLDLNNIGTDQPAGVIEQAHNQAFDIQGLSDDFFRQYKVVFEEVLRQVEGFGTDADARYLFTQNLFNRLLFIAFIQKKGWLRFSDQSDYLPALWLHYQGHRPPNGNFYAEFLSPLFFDGLNKHSSLRPEITGGLGQVPYLNGGLFAATEVDTLPDVRVPDESIRLILDELFSHYDFALSENTEIDQEIAVDPEMLGHVFEELVTNRKENGAYYTPKLVVAYMCREALKRYLVASVPHESEAAITRFIDGNDPRVIKDRECIYNALDAVKVCDPACGSGAYLFGMLQILVELRGLLFQALNIPSKMAYKRKLHIIQNNLYGVDLDRIAVNIARLRLWLSLAVEYEDSDPPLMPNLDFKIEVGDSLTAPPPQKPLQPGLFRDKLELFADSLNFLQTRYLTANEADREALFGEIRKAQDEAQNALSDVEPLPPGAFDWRVRFADVFTNGGFDVILANPPYVRAMFIQNRSQLQKLFPDFFVETGDLYLAFYGRAQQLLRAGGVACFISPNKWLKAKYGKKLRQNLLDAQAFHLVIDFDRLPVFKAAEAYPCIFLWQKTPRNNTPTLWTKVDNLEKCYEQGIQNYAAANGQLIPASRFSEDQDRFASEQTAGIIRQMRAHAVPLKEYVQGNIYRGIVSGLNNAFIIGEGSYKELVEQDPNSKEILKPVIRGADIHRYEVEYQNEYFIYVPWGFPIEKYPAVFQHLSKYRAALEARPEVKASRYQWYEMSRYGREFVHLFNAPKIVYPVISQRPNFAMDENKYYGNDKMFFLASADWYLLGLLNSKRIQTWVSEKFSPLQNGYYEFRGIYMENLPIPLASDEIRAAVAGLAQETQANYAERRQFAAAWWAQNGLPKNRCPGQLWEYSFEAFHKAHKAVSRADFCSMQDQAHALTEGIVKKEEEIDRYAAGIYEVE